MINVLCIRCLPHPILYYAIAWWSAIILHGTGVGPVSSVWLSYDLEEDLSGAER